MTAVVDALRALLAGQPVGDALWAALGWCVAVLVVAYAVATLVWRRRAA